MSVLFDLVDPSTGERVRMHAYIRRGRVVVSRLPRQNTSDPGSPGVLEARAAFATAAATGFGERRNGGSALPPAAVRVTQQMRGLRLRATSGVEPGPAEELGHGLPFDTELDAGILMHLRLLELRRRPK